jgi:hypothetical protein
VKIALPTLADLPPANIGQLTDDQHRGHGRQRPLNDSGGLPFLPPAAF